MFSGIICPETKDIVWSPSYSTQGQNVSRLLSDFEELEFLGKGSFGCVSLVKSKMDHQSYAVKKILLDKSYGYEKASREVIALARLSHSNVVRYHSAWLEEAWAGIKAGKIKEEPMVCIQMELCFGSVKDLMGKTLTDEKLWDIFRQTTIGVDYLHSQSVRHGDLSPANLFLDESREIIKIGDFGFSTATTGLLGRDECRVCSFYGAPEVRRESLVEEGSPYTLKADIYSLGVILFEMFGRYDAVEDSSRRSTELEAFIVSRQLPEWTENLENDISRLILAMTNSDPNIRPTTGQIIGQPPWVGSVLDYLRLIME